MSSFYASHCWELVKVLLALKPCFWVASLLFLFLFFVSTELFEVRSIMYQHFFGIATGICKNSTFFFPLLENLNETKDLTLKMLTFCGYIMANCTVLLIYGKLHNQATNPVWWFEEARNSTSTRRKIHVTLSGSVSLTLLAFYCSFTKSHTDLYMLQAYYPTI